MSKIERSKKKKELKPGQYVWVKMRVLWHDLESNLVSLSDEYPCKCPEEESFMVKRGECYTTKEGQP